MGLRSPSSSKLPLLDRGGHLFEINRGFLADFLHDLLDIIQGAQQGL